MLDQEVHVVSEDLDLGKTLASSQDFLSENKDRRKPHPVDIHVGKMLRKYRIMKGMSQHELGASVSVTFQQIQKYEKGSNRVGASRLYDFSAALQVGVSEFFHGYKDQNKNKLSSLHDRSSYEEGDGEDGAEENGGYLRSSVDYEIDREVLALIRSYKKIREPKLKSRIISLIKAMSDSSDDEGNDS